MNRVIPGNRGQVGGRQFKIRWREVDDRGEEVWRISRVGDTFFKRDNFGWGMDASGPVWGTCKGSR